MSAAINHSDVTVPISWFKHLSRSLCRSMSRSQARSGIYFRSGSRPFRPWAALRSRSRSRSVRFVV